MPYLKTTLFSQLQAQQSQMIKQLTAWAQLSSWSQDLEGLEKMRHALRAAFGPLATLVEEIKLPTYTTYALTGELCEQSSGCALRLRQRPDAPVQILLGGHYDTVYPPHQPAVVEQVDLTTLKGPGVADMKGGLVVLLKALEAFEHHPEASNLGWEILLTPDEELGSPASRHLWQEAAKRHRIALLYESSGPNGALVTRRKGSRIFTVLVEGKAAHAGRDFFTGHSAIDALAALVNAIERLSNPANGLTLNTGVIQGGTALNTVAAQAGAQLLLRGWDEAALTAAEEQIKAIATDIAAARKVTIAVHPGPTRPVKLFSPPSQKLYQQLEQCGATLGLSLPQVEVGGVCDGNFLAAAGLAVADNLGVIGGRLHSPDEFMLVESLGARAALSLALLIELAKDA